MSTRHHHAARVAFESIAPDLLRYFMRRVSHQEDAADLLGETFLTAWKRIADLPGDDDGRRRWMFTIAAWTLANHRRGWRRRTNVVGKLTAQLATVNEPDHSDVVEVRDAVRRLPEAYRELVMLVHWEGFRLDEASEILRINSSTARSRYAAARALLREALTAQDELVCSP